MSASFFDPVVEAMEMVAAGVPQAQAVKVVDARLNAILAARSQPNPIPFHGDRFVGMGAPTGDPAANVMMRESKGVFAIAKRPIVDRIASLEWCVVVQRRVSDGTIEEEELDDHPLKLLLDNPSPTHSAQQTRRLIADWMITVGEAYLLKVGKRPIPDFLYTMLPDHVSPLASMGRITGYLVIGGDGKQQEIPATDVVRIWNPDPSTLYTARGVMAPQAVTIDALSFQEQHLRSHYETNAIPPAVIQGSQVAQAPDTTDRDRFDQHWASNYHQRFGLKRGLPAWIPPGWEFKAIQAHGGDTDMLKSMEFHRDLIFMALGTPRSIVGDVVDANRAAAETNQYVFDRHTVTPYTDMIADALTTQLAADYPQPKGTRLVVKFEEFVAPDEDLRLREENQDLRLKVRSINMVLEDRKADPVSWGDLPVGSFADIPYTGEQMEAGANPLLMQGGAGEPSDAGATSDGSSPDGVGDGTPADTAKATLSGYLRMGEQKRLEWQRFLHRERTYVPLFTVRMKRVFAIQRDTVLERLDKQRMRATRVSISIWDLFSPSEWTRLFKREVEPVRRQAFAASAQEAMTSVDAHTAFVFTEAVASKLEMDGQLFEDLVNTTTQRKLSAELADAAKEGESVDQIAKRVRHVFSVRRNNAVMIARTEMAGATQAAQVEGFKQSGVVTQHQWNTSQDDLVRDAHEIDGQVTTIDGTFDLADGVAARYPGDPSLPAEDRINCRCFLTPVLGDS